MQGRRLGLGPLEGVLEAVEQRGLGDAEAPCGRRHGDAFGKDGAQRLLHLVLRPARVAPAPRRKERLCTCEDPDANTAVG